MLPRFYVPDAQAGATEVVLPREEAHHATRVLRLRPGADIAIFDGRGREWHARIASSTREGVRASVVEPLVPAREPRTAITLAQAVLKGDHMDAVIRDATMVGVSVIVPLVTERTIARVDPTAASRARARWLRVALASAKQCRRALLPAIEEPATVEELVSRTPMPAETRIVLAEPSTRVRALPPTEIRGSAAAVLAVGPEGGWSAGELSAFSGAGYLALTLGPLTIRADAAAVIAASMLRAAWQDL